MNRAYKYQQTFSLLKHNSSYNFTIVRDINAPKPNGKLSIVATPIGNLSDLTPNILKCLFRADLIGCQDRRVAGQLYTLIRNKNILQRIQQKFGTIGISNLILNQARNPQEQFKDQTQRSHTFYDYSNMNDKQRRKFQAKMTVQQAKAFRIQYLKYRAKKIINKQQQFLYRSKRQKFDELYGIDISDYKHIQTQIINTRTKKGRGLLIPLNTYSQTKMFDMIKKMLQSKHVAVVSDAGMPCISDPGWKVVRMVRQHMPQLPIQVIGGPSAIDIMLTLSSATTNSKSLSGRFEGFASPEVSSITSQNMTYNKYMKMAKQKDFSIHFINSKKLKKYIYTLQKIYGENHRIILANELTKKYERIFSGTLKELGEHISKQDKQFQGIGEMSYLLYADKNKINKQSQDSKNQQKFQQKEVNHQQQIESAQQRITSLNIFNFIKSLQGTGLKAKQKADLVSSVFGLKHNKAKKYVYQAENKPLLRPLSGFK